MAATAALIVAAGRGTRLGDGADGTPKQYRALAGRALLAHSAATFARHPGVDSVRVVIREADRALYESATAGLRLLDPVPGGETRRDSVRLGLESLAGAAPARVLIHDAARPFASAGLISRVLDALDDHDGAIPGLAVADSLKRAEGGAVTAVPRDNLYRAQTPQGFRFGPLLEAHRAAAGDDAGELTDDAVVAERAGLRVAMVAGEESNLKITTADDLARAEAWLSAAAESRTGYGTDLHAFGEAPGPVRLCGVEIPHERALAGHSDADSGLHAVTDALLGALGAGDIGEHFPPGDPAWKDADSAAFLARAAELAADAGGRIVNVDVTLVCEAPRIAPHRAAMRARLAEILGIDAARVSVKASTTEGLGALGRGEGVAAQAVCTVALPRRP